MEEEIEVYEVQIRQYLKSLLQGNLTEAEGHLEIVFGGLILCNIYNNPLERK